MADFVIGQGDDLENLIINLFTAAGEFETVDPADTVTLLMYLASDTTQTQSHTMTLLDQAKAKYQYAWAPEDTQIAGVWLCKLQRTRISDGKKKTYPNDDSFFTILIGQATP